jgi:hypothetical protein
MDQLAGYIINLPHRTDRRAEMEAQLRLSGLSADFFPASRPTETAGFPSIGARGCYLSHLAVLRDAAKRGCHVMVMEDDLDFVPEFRSRWHKALADLETNPWSIFYPAHLLENTASGVTEVASDTHLLCAHFVVFHRDAVATIVAGLERILARPPGHPDGGPMHVDGAYSTLRQQDPGLRTFICAPSLGHQRSSRSDIASNRFYDRIGLLQPVIGALRRLKRRVRA